MSPAVTGMARRMGIALGMNASHGRWVLGPDVGLWQPGGAPARAGYHYRLPFLGSDFVACATQHGWTST